jgi:hypothetical protein
MKLNHEEIDAVLSSLENLIGENREKIKRLREKELRLEKEIIYYESLRDRFLNLPLKEFV